MTGISEGIVLADRYRLVRRQIERGIGATWVAADTETGSDVWVQFADHGGLGEAARFVGTIPTGTANEIASVLSYLYSPVGS